MDSLLLVSQYGVPMQYCPFLFLRKIASLDVRPQVVSPSQSAALPTSIKPYIKNKFHDLAFSFFEVARVDDEGKGTLHVRMYLLHACQTQERERENLHI